MKAGAKLDALVAEHVMGWFPEVDWVYQPPQHNWRDESGYRAIMNHPDQLPGLPMWSPSTEISEAWEVVEHLRSQGLSVEVYGHEQDDRPDDGFGVVLKDTLGTVHGRASARFAPYAICLAALEAVGAKVSR